MIDCFSQVYWLGDLNYRVTDMSTSEVKSHLAMQNLAAILNVDQLNQQKDKGRVLQVDFGLL